MTDLLAWVVSSSVLILVILAVRALGKNRLSCRARYGLWLLALVRLLIPVQLFTTSWGLSAPPLPEHMTEKQFVLPQNMWQTDTGQTGQSERTGLLTVIAPNLNGGPADAARSDAAPGAALPNAVPETEGTPSAGAAAFRWSAADVLRAVYLTGAGTLALILLASNLRFARRLRRTRVRYDALCGGMRVYVAEGLASPCLVGVLRPSVYLTPEATRDERTLRHVLAHETTHRIHGDCVWSLLRLAALCLHWYNPLVWLAAVVSKRDGELACDERTLARLGEDERTAYGETLLSLVRARPDTRGLLSVSTAMTAGRKPMRERIETIARHPRTKTAALLLAVAVLLTATAVAFSRRAAKAEDAPPAEPDAAPQPVSAPSEARGAYAGVEDYLASVPKSAPETVTYYAQGPEGNASKLYEAVANVLDVRTGNLEKLGELSGLAPEGTLELYRYDVLYKTDAPLEEILLAGGVSADGGYVDFEGQGGHAVIALRYADGSVDVLLDRLNGDNMGGVWYYHDNAGEALCDWYVKENGLDLPLYVIDLLPTSELGNFPAHRVDGDGWYFYLPVQAWYRADEGGTACWYSQYDTSAKLAVAHLDESAGDAAVRYQSWDWTLAQESVPTVRRTSGKDGSVHTTIRFHDDGNGGCWQVRTQYDVKMQLYSSYIAWNPEVLEAMAASFVPDVSMRAPEFDIDAELATFVKRLGDDEPAVALRLLDSELHGPYESGVSVPNAASVCAALRQCAFTRTTGVPVGDGGERYVVTIEALGCSMSFNEGNYIQFWTTDWAGNEAHGCYRAEGCDDLLGLARMWFDEAELSGLGGGYGSQYRIVVADAETYLEAAQEHCDRLLDVSLQVSTGSAFRYTYVKCLAESAEKETASFRETGKIGENQWAFTLTEIFVPENEAAYQYGMAGNTMDYAEYVREYAPEAYDPDVPEGACICWRVGYVTKEADGYHTRLVGTGW